MTTLWRLWGDFPITQSIQILGSNELSGEEIYEMLVTNPSLTQPWVPSIHSLLTLCSVRAKKITANIARILNKPSDYNLYNSGSNSHQIPSSWVGFCERIVWVEKCFEWWQNQHQLDQLRTISFVIAFPIVGITREAETKRNEFAFEQQAGNRLKTGQLIDWCLRDVWGLALAIKVHLISRSACLLLPTAIWYQSRSIAPRCVILTVILWCVVSLRLLMRFNCVFPGNLFFLILIFTVLITFPIYYDR